MRHVLFALPILAALLVLPAAPASAYEPSMINMRAPSGMTARQLDFTVMHRFFGNMAKGENPVAEGANVGVRFRYMPLNGLELETSYTAYRSELAAGASYTRAIPGVPLKAQLRGAYYNFSADGKRRNGGFGALTAQSEPLFGQLRLSGTVGYDSYFNRPHLGGGLTVELGRRLSILGEYFPLFGGSDVDARGDSGAYAFGFAIETAGHHFTILAANRYDIGEHWQAGGGRTSRLHLGFNLQRAFWF
jgi:hypothetical protein